MLAYFDCFSGISGDMTLGALVDAGLPVDYLRAELAKLPVGGYALIADVVTRHGLRGTALRVRLDSAAEQPHRHLADILAIIEGSALAPRIKTRAAAVFRALAEAEAKVHGIGIPQVHFHEVGAVDAIVDVVGVAIGLEYHGVEQVYASAVPVGSGTVRAAHGLLPVPAPATLELLRAANAPIRPNPSAGPGQPAVEVELATPTGMAILAALATFALPPIQIAKTGHGFGMKELPWPNLLRVWLGASAPSQGVPPEFATDTITIVEANIDDMTPEALGAAMAKLLAAGALDVYFTPIQMKKNRPATKLTVLAAAGQEHDLAAQILRETTTLGVRLLPSRRIKCERSQEMVTTPWGSIRIKVKRIGAARFVAPEYDDCLAAAERHGIPFDEVYEVAKQAAGE